MRLEDVLSESAPRIGELITKYPEMDIGDATLVGLSERHAGAQLITMDSDFRYYRRNGTEMIPVVMPAED